MSRIISIGTAVPPFGVKQDKILEFMQEAYADETASRKLNALFRLSRIHSRYSVVPDFDTSRKTKVLFDENGPPDVEQRMKLFQELSLPLALDAIDQVFRKAGDKIKPSQITHLITITCTGLLAPGLDTLIMEELGLSEDVFRTGINFQGCNAAFPAMKVADMIARTDRNARVLLVAVELCTLHFKPKNNDDNLLSNTIFGDGAAAMIIVSREIAESSGYHGLEINDFYSCLLGSGKGLMGWNINPLHFEMILSARIPFFIGSSIRELMTKAGNRLNMLPGSIDKWAIHPGGRKILDSIQEVLELSDIQLSHSYQVLRQYGNMSSPTILFILNEILNDQLTAGNTVFSIGFGPGISVDTALFTYA